MFPIPQSARDELSVELAKLYAVEKLRINENFDAKVFAQTYLNAKADIQKVIDRVDDPL